MAEVLFPSPTPTSPTYHFTLSSSSSSSSNSSNPSSINSISPWIVTGPSPGEKSKG